MMLSSIANINGVQKVTSIRPEEPFPGGASVEVSVTGGPVSSEAFEGVGTDDGTGFSMGIGTDVDEVGTGGAALVVARLVVVNFLFKQANYQLIFQPKPTLTKTS